MSNVISRGAESNSVPSDAILTGFRADMNAVELEIADRAAFDAELAEINASDAAHCRHCGRESAGLSIVGTHLQICDGCLIVLVREQIGVVL